MNTSRTNGDAPHARERRVLIAHGVALYRAGVRHVLAGDPRFVVVGDADRADVAYHAFVEIDPDVCLIDHELPPGGCAETMRRMLARKPDIAIAVVGVKGDGLSALRLMEQGALACLGRESDGDAILRAVREVASGHRYLTHDLAQQVAMLRLKPRQDLLSALSPREFEVFRLVSQGMAPPDIARCLTLSMRSVANYTCQVKRKLGVTTTAEMVHLAVRHRVIEISD